MTVTRIDKDPEAMTMTITAEFDAPIERAWQLWEDPRLLERWWGPPTYPATFVEHDLRPGGRATYFMTGPEGDQPRGWWRVLEMDAPQHLTFESGFGHPDDSPDVTMPVMVMHVELTNTPSGGTVMAVRASFSSLEAMERIMAMGMEEGLAQAMGQIDALVRPS